jgi:hypothetical protein
MPRAAPPAVRRNRPAADFGPRHDRGLHRQPPALAAGVEVPYVVAVIELAEQHDIRLMTNMPRTPIEDVHVGMKVKVFFEQHGEIFVPLFEAA